MTEINIIADFVGITHGGSGTDAPPVEVASRSREHD
jgi:hypothetical protein